MIPIYKPFIYDEAKNLANQAISDGMIAAGPCIEQFEKQISELCKRKYAVSCCNGTVALYLAVKSLNLPKNSEVIIPSMTIVSCLTAILENSLVPVFCDINPQTWNIDFSSVENLITKNTSAVLVIDTYGLMIDTDELQLFRNKYKHIKIIEDASEAHGAHHKGRVAGSVGDISTFSFYSNKIVTTGEGGMIMTDDDEVYKNLLLLRNLNFIDRKKYIHSDAGFNFRITNLQCAIGIGQLANMQETIYHRKRVAHRYNNTLRNCEFIQLPYEDASYNNVYWYYGIIVHKNYQNIINALVDNNVDYRHFFHPLHKQPFISDPQQIKNSEYAFENGILLPIFNELSDEDVDFISNIIIEAI